jgi:glycosyltransferase involved in cell wall biosynthesis
MKPKVLFILHWPPPVHGSAVVGLQIKKSKIINSSFDCSYVNLGTSKSIDEIGRNAILKVVRYISIVLKVLWYLINNKPKLCYFAITAKGPAFYKDALIVLLIKMFRVKLVYHFHNKGVKTRKDKYFDNLLYKIVFENSKVILLSQYLYEDVQDYISLTDIYICPNGIPQNNITKRQFNKKEKETVKILFLSNLIKSKGVYIMLEACSILNQNGIAFQCDFIGGEGDMKANQFNEKVKLLGLTKQVNYLGKKYGEEKNKAFGNADIFAFPTFNDCFPLVLLEALNYELPIISTFEGGIPEIVEDGVNGFLIPQKNADTLAEKLEILIKNPDLRKTMGEAGLKKYTEKFTSANFELRFKEIISEIIK